MERNAPVARHGLAVLLRQGVAAWMEAWSGIPAAPVPRLPADERPNPWPDSMNTELVHLLASMALEHIQEVVA